MLKRVPSVAAAAMCMAIAACGSTPPIARQATLERLYESAIFDAAVYNPAHRAPLRVLSPDSPVATVVAWMRAEEAEHYPLGARTLAREVWVTPDGEVRSLCRDYRFLEESKLRLRLQQLLGLRPVFESRVFVTLQAPVEQIFRPCLDPDVTQPSCDRQNFPSGISDEHKAWIATQMVSSYRIDTTGANSNGNPWTGLGYTYDWAPESNNVGPSEYVVRAGTLVSVVAKEGPTAYCGK